MICPGGTPPVQFGGRLVCFQGMPAGFAGSGLGLGLGGPSLIKWGLIALASYAGYRTYQKYR